MARVTPQQALDKWTRRTKGATQDYVNGVNSVTTAPGAAAARQKQLYLDQVQSKADKWAANVGSVSLQDWQTAAANTGAQRISGGVDKAQAKMGTAMANLLPFIDGHVNAIKQMPKGSLEQNIARSVEFQRRMSTYKRR